MEVKVKYRWRSKQSSDSFNSVHLTPSLAWRTQLLSQVGPFDSRRFNILDSKELNTLDSRELDILALKGLNTLNSRGLKLLDSSRSLHSRLQELNYFAQTVRFSRPLSIYFLSLFTVGVLYPMLTHWHLLWIFLNIAPWMNEESIIQLSDMVGPLDVSL